MLFIVLALLFMVALLDKTLRLDRRKFVLLEAGLKFDAIRDDLLLKVHDGKQPDNEAYRTFENDLNELSRFWGANSIIWTLTVVIWFIEDHEDSKERADKREEFERALELPENHHLAAAFTASRSVMREFIDKRHPLLSFLRNKFESIETWLISVEETPPPKLNANIAGMLSGLRFRH
jgi:hypothetical protein